MTTSPALALDQYLSQLTPGDRAAMRKALPVALLDQTEAANADVDNLVHMVGRSMKSSVADLDYTQVPEWVRLSVTDTLVGFMTGTVATCMHNPNPNHPQPVFAAAWKPGLITCSACLHLFRLVGAADRTCDRCGCVRTGKPGDGVHACTLTFGQLVFSYGLCPDCLKDHKAAAS